MDRARILELTQFRDFGVIEQTDQMRVDQAEMEKRLLTIEPLKVTKYKDMTISEAKRIAGKSKRTKLNV